MLLLLISADKNVYRKSYTHMGHTRNVCLGKDFTRITKRCIYPVISQNTEMVYRPKLGCLCGTLLNHPSPSLT